LFVAKHGRLPNGLRSGTRQNSCRMSLLSQDIKPTCLKEQDRTTRERFWKKEKYSKEKLALISSSRNSNKSH
jgi:type II secretory pathway component PulF